jgi:fluoride exporter
VTVLAIAVGAALGAPLRYLTDRLIQRRHDSVFPWGTLAVNVAGSLLLGVLVGLPADETVMALAGTGFCGTLTTYSSFSYETLRLAQDGAWRHAIANVAGSLAAGLGAFAAGLTLAHAITA